MKILHLTLKKKWFEMILSNEKKEEYREIKSHWLNRLCKRYPLSILVGGDFVDKHTGINYDFKHFDVIEFTNGYRKDSPKIQIECKGISIGKPNILWCDGDIKNDVFIIKLGKLIKYIN